MGKLFRRIVISFLIFSTLSSFAVETCHCYDLCNQCLLCQGKQKRGTLYGIKQNIKKLKGKEKWCLPREVLATYQWEIYHFFTEDGWLLYPTGFFDFEMGSKLRKYGPGWFRISPFYELWRPVEAFTYRTRTEKIKYYREYNERINALRRILAWHENEKRERKQLRSKIDALEERIDILFASIHNRCISLHFNVHTAYDHGLWLFQHGNYADCFLEIEKLLKKADKSQLERLFKDIKLVLGEAYLESGLYQKAVTTRGELAGDLIGKYGVDIFLTCASIKGIQLMNNLKKANRILTLERLSTTSAQANSIKMVSTDWHARHLKAMQQFKQAKAADEFLKPFRKTYLPESQVRKILHQAGYNP